jgi:hypothetical protein
MLRMALRVRHGAACDTVERKTRLKIEVVQQRRSWKTVTTSGTKTVLAATGGVAFGATILPNTKTSRSPGGASS